MSFWLMMSVILTSKWEVCPTTSFRILKFKIWKSRSEETKDHRQTMTYRWKDDHQAPGLARELHLRYNNCRSDDDKCKPRTIWFAWHGTVRYGTAWHGTSYQQQHHQENWDDNEKTMRFEPSKKWSRIATHGQYEKPNKKQKEEKK